MVFSSTDFDCHERVVYCYDQPSGLRAIIAIHNTSRGPALGGSRAWRYSSETDALRDVLRLSRGMTYKAAMANLPLGGGKAVMMLPEDGTPLSNDMLRRFGDAVEGLGGHYITAEDVGTTAANMEIIRERTQHVVGLPRSTGGGSGDPSPVTAYGTWKGIQAAIAHQLGQNDLKGIRVAVQGVGSVGAELCRLLHESGASLVVADVNEEGLKEVVRQYNAETVGVDVIYDADVDVFCPCALGAILNSETIPRLKASIVAGAANNQLASPSHDALLSEKGILYAPDYVINAGGLINVTYEGPNYNREIALKHVDGIFDTLTEVFQRAVERNIPTGQAADEVAEQRFSRPCDNGDNGDYDELMVSSGRLSGR